VRVREEGWVEGYTPRRQEGTSGSMIHLSRGVLFFFTSHPGCLAFENALSGLKSMQQCYICSHGTGTRRRSTDRSMEKIAMEVGSKEESCCIGFGGNEGEEADVVRPVKILGS